MTRESSRRRTRHLSRAFGFASSLALLSGAGIAEAQVDLYPPPPNILLLVDTSGSMEFQVDGSEVTCTPGNPAGTNDRSRWTQVVEALTGTIDNYSCETIDRLSSSFRDGVYRLNGEAPYDYNYTVPFHRALSGGCAAMPGNLPGTNAFVYPTGAVAFKDYASMATCTFSQQSDGIIDNFGALVRFGLMTFDTSTHPGTGYSGTSPNLANGIQGTWSYVVGSSVQGAPANCDLTDQEVGARNAAAPAWEGRMVNFGNPSTGLSANLTKAQQIEDIIRATRPFGATPIAGMLKDAEDFFRNDESVDQDPEPAGATLAFGPSHKGDPYVDLGCREQSILLLSDGQPNLDLRTECEESDPSCPETDPECKCPFDRPESIALRLASAAKEPVKTSVIAFALSSFQVGSTSMTCNDDEILDSACADPSQSENHALQACCTLRRIARDGGGLFASVGSAAELRKAMNEIISANIKPSSRTQPVLASSTSGASSTQRFFSSFRPMKTEAWQGVLERQRYECVDDSENPGQKVPEAQTVDADKGDKFAENIASDPANRNFYTVRAGTGSAPIDPRASIRPGISDTILDGVGPYKGTLVHGKPNAPSSDLFSADIAGVSMDMPKTGCGSTNATTCGRFFMNWLVGNPNSGSEDTRCESASNCNLLGDILHSTPKVVGRPVSLLRDETYSKFAFDNATRPVVLYVSTNDGILHAFKTASNDPADTTEEDRVLRRTNNELWAFIPPAVLPDLYKLYPQNHELLLDGAPVIKDVVAAFDDDDTIRFERTVANAQSALGTWRTVLIQSFGAKRPGYFAIDVTEPIPDDSEPIPDPSDADHSRGGPRFLWQLTEDEEGNPLFGQGGVTPLITTLFFDPDGGSDSPREIAVAVLPGGVGSIGTPGAGNAGCSTAGSTFTGLPIEAGFEPRTHVKCYAEHPGAHSLTVVRLDTGEIIRTFRRTDTEVPTLKDLSPPRVIVTPGLDSPISGQPVAYPSDVGAVADRVFVGDADGRLWKVDLSNPDPASWKMGLFFDAFSNGTFLTNTPSSGQPIQTPPVLSVDDRGNITVAISTGDQDTGGTVANLTNYVYSLTESLTAERDKFETLVNWYKPLEDGERVTGAMALFSSELFFSTYKGPESTEVCSSGTSNIYGMHYLIPKEDTEGDDGGALTNVFGGEEFVTAGELAGISPDDEEQPIVFGVTVAQLPTCISEQAAAEDDWLGLGQHSTVTHVNPGKFQLLMQAGRTGQSIEGAETKTITKELETPQSFSSVDSWTAILE